MKKTIIITVISTVAAFILILILGILWFYNSMNSLENWSQDGVSWQEVKIPIDNYSGKVVFESQNAHPYLAQHNFKIKVKNDGKEREFPLSNGSGKMNEPIYLITYENKQYLEVRQVVIDLTTVTQASNDLDAKGSKELLGKVSKDDWGNLTFNK